MTSLELPWLVAPNNKRPLPLYISQTKIFIFFPPVVLLFSRGHILLLRQLEPFFFRQPFPLQNVALNACGVIELIRLSLFIYFTHNTQLN